MKTAENNYGDIAIIGAGAAGLTAASFASASRFGITVFEKNVSERKLAQDDFFDNAYLGKKLLITGKGRCNITNACSVQDFLNNVTKNPKFLYSALKGFDSVATADFFIANGCKVKIERGNRVFPVSDKSRDVLEALKRSILRNNCRFINTAVKKVTKQGDVFVVECENGKVYRFFKVIICTGGLSYPITGSDGDGYTFAASVGHTITETRGSLVPIELDGEFWRKLQGLSLRNVVLSLYDGKGKKVFSEQGEMIFTHFGISGPIVLSCSAHMRNDIFQYKLEIDFKPALDEATLEERLISDFRKYANKDICNAMRDLLPVKMILPFVEICGLPRELKPNSLKKEQRRIILNTLKHFPLEVKQLRPVEEAVVTSGGVDVNEVNPSTMESKICAGMYFAGEILDVDAYTGGFNLQIAFSTGRLAALSAVKAMEMNGE